MSVQELVSLNNHYYLKQGEAYLILEAYNLFIYIEMPTHETDSAVINFLICILITTVFYELRNIGVLN